MSHSTSASSPVRDTGTSPVCAVIHLEHLRHNVRILQKRAGRAKIMGVVKADAYGHGAVRVAEVLHEEGVRHLAVARIPEAVELRSAGVTDPILVLGAPLPHDLPAYAAHSLDVTVSSRDIAEAVMAAASERDPYRVHVKVDTGMGRIGMTPAEALPVVRQLRRVKGIDLVSLWTHFATAGRPNGDFAKTQLDRFKQIVSEVGDAALCVHAANSRALLDWEASFRPFDPAMVRLGISLYGLARQPDRTGPSDFRPVMQMTARVVHLKTVAPGTSVSYGRRWHAARRTRIATLAAGYGDGYLRRLSNRAEVGLRERRVPVVGTICMDMLMVDVGPVDGGPEVAVGDTAVLFGPGGPSALEVAAWADTIPYEVCCRVADRVPRIYTDEA